MKFLIDAQLPRTLCAVFVAAGHEAIHTRDLPDENRTKDRVINQRSLDEHRVVVSKDTDFFYSHVLQGRPWKLLLVKTGNVSTRDLCALVARNLPAIEQALIDSSLVEIDHADVRPIL